MSLEIKIATIVEVWIQFWLFWIDVILQEALDLRITTTAVPLATVKSNPSGTTFSWDLFVFLFIVILKQRRTFPVETLKSVPLLSEKLKMNNYRRRRHCLIGVRLPV